MKFYVFVHADQDDSMALFGKATGQVMVEPTTGGNLWRFEKQDDMLAFIDDVSGGNYQ